jgi:hypothetical protein
MKTSTKFALNLIDMEEFNKKFYGAKKITSDILLIISWIRIAERDRHKEKRKDKTHMTHQK